MLSNRTTIAIGGLGGSGTRLVAQLLQKHGFNIGNALNKALDNLFFTLLFRRSSWSESFPDDKEIETAIQIFLAHSSPECSSFLTNEAEQYVEQLLNSNSVTMFTKGVWLDKIEEHFANTSGIEERYSNIVWKEPTTHIFLPQLYSYIEDFKYIHLVRDGLYMAQSSNQNQLKLWGNSLGTELSEPLLSIPNAFNYWHTANKRAISYGHNNIGENFYLANYDNICQNPQQELNRILSFIGVEPNTEMVLELAAQIRHTCLNPNEILDVKKGLNEMQLEQYRTMKTLTNAL